MIAEEARRARMTVGKLHAHNTLESLQDLGLEPGMNVWGGFRSTAVKVFEPLANLP